MMSNSPPKMLETIGGEDMNKFLKLIRNYIIIEQDIMNFKLEEGNISKFMEFTNTSRVLIKKIIDMIELDPKN